MGIDYLVLLNYQIVAVFDSKKEAIGLFEKILKDFPQGFVQVAEVLRCSTIGEVQLIEQPTSEPLYQLRQPVKTRIIPDYFDKDRVAIYPVDGIEHIAYVYPGLFEKYFVELNVSRLSTDIEQILQEVHRDGTYAGDPSDDYYPEDYGFLGAFAERIVGLLTQPNQEEK